MIIPHDVQQAPAPDLDHEHGIVTSAPVWSPPNLVPAAGDLEAAAAVINDGERVAFLVGQGARGAWPQVRALAEKTGAGITTSLMGKPYVDESHPLAAGVMGHLGTSASGFVLGECDTLVIVGSNDPWTEFYPPPGAARAVQIDVDAAAIGNRYPVEAAVTGDAAAALDAQVAVDVGSSVYWYARQLRLPAGVPAHLSSTLASMGCSIPYGLAAKLAAPERPVVALSGDGAMQMAGLSELITVSRLWPRWADPRFVLMVLNNRELAEVTWEQREMEGDPRFEQSQALPDFSYARYAELLGLQGIRVEDPAQIGPAWDAALDADRPVLIEVLSDPDVPLLPPFPAGRSKGKEMMDALEKEGPDTAHARELLQEYLRQEEDLAGS